MQKEAKLFIDNSLILSPGLTYSATSAEGEGEVTVNQSSCLHQVGVTHLVSEDEAPAVRFSFQNSIIDCGQFLVWLPLGNEETLRKSLTYEANQVLFLIGKGLLNSSPRPRIASRRVGALDRWEASQWAEFWGGSQKQVDIQKGFLIERANLTERNLEEFMAAEFQAPEGFEDLGAGLESVGPLRTSLK